MMRGWAKGAAVVVAVLATAGCELALDIDVDERLHVRGSGFVVTSARHVSPFHTIDARGAVVVIVERTGRERVEVSAEDNLIDFIETRVRDGVLSIGPEHGVSLSPRREVVVRIEAYELVEIIGSGAVEIEADLGRQPELFVRLSGASSARTIGSAGRQDVDLSGASEYDGLDFESDRTHVLASGASRAWVRVRDRLDATASGASAIWFAGSPYVVASTSGGATVRPY